MNNKEEINVGMNLINKIYGVEDRIKVSMVEVNDGERVPYDPNVKVKLVGEERPDESMDEGDEVLRLNNLIELYIDIVKYKKQLDYQDHYGNTALIVAVQTGNEAIVKALIDAGADVTIQNNDRNTAIFYAITMNRPDIYKQLATKLKGGGQRLNKLTRAQEKELRQILAMRRKYPYPSQSRSGPKTYDEIIDKLMYNYFLWNDGKNYKTYDRLEKIEGFGYSPEHLNNRTSPGNNFVQEVKRNSRANSYSQNPNVDNDLTNEDSEYLNKIRETEKENELYKNLGGKKRKTKKGKRGNKSKESRKGKKSRKERKSIKGKKIKR